MDHNETILEIMVEQCENKVQTVHDIIEQYVIGLPLENLRVPYNQDFFRSLANAFDVDINLNWTCSGNYNFNSEQQMPMSPNTLCVYVSNSKVDYQQTEDGLVRV